MEVERGENERVDMKSVATRLIDWLSIKSNYDNFAKRLELQSINYKAQR